MYCATNTGAAIGFHETKEVIKPLTENEKFRLDNYKSKGIMRLADYQVRDWHILAAQQAAYVMSKQT